MMTKNELIEELQKIDGDPEVLMFVRTYKDEKDNEGESEYFRIEDCDIGTGLDEAFIEITSIGAVY